MSSGVRHEPGRCPKGRADGKGDRAGCGGVLLHGRILGVPADGGQEQPGVGLRHRAGVPPGPAAGLAARHRLHDRGVRLPAGRPALRCAGPGPAHPGSRAGVRLRLPGRGRPGRVKRRDWLAAAAMSAGIGVFLRVASPSGGQLHAPGSAWLVAGLATLGVVLLALAVAFGLGRRPGASGTRRAAVLGAATGISWGFMAAVIKELSSHLDNDIGAIFSSWSLYLRSTGRSSPRPRRRCRAGGRRWRVSGWTNRSPAFSARS